MESELTLNRIKDAIISVDREWRYVFLNDAALDTHPLGREETLGKTLWDIHPQMIDSMFWHTYHRAMETGTIAEFESYYKTMDKWFSVKVYPSDTGLTIFYQDIDKSKRMRIRLAKSEEKYRTLFYKSPLPKWLYDIETLNFIDVNEAAINHYGYSRSEFLAMTIKDIRPEEDVEEFFGFMEKVRNDSESSRNSHWRHRKKNGDILIADLTAHSFSYNGRAMRIIIVNDVTQKEIMEKQILENQLKLNEAQSIGRLGYWDIDLEKNLHSWSDELYKIFGLDKAETEPSVSLFLSFIHPDDKWKAEGILNQALTDFAEAKIDFRFITHTGKKRYGYIEWRFEYTKNNMPKRLFGILQDITERKQAEEGAKLLHSKIKEQKIQAQKKISKAIIKAQEQQKNYIAQELHDNISQILFGIKFQLGLAGRKDETVKELIKYPVEQISRAMDEIHLLSQNLVTPLTDVNLEEIVCDLIQKINPNKENPININFTCVIPVQISDDLKLNIYRIIQEQLQNIVKHADAKNVSVALEIIDRNILITVEDDGKGFDVKQKRKGLGISNIIHRAESFNGKVEIQSMVRKGSKMAVTIPYRV